MSLILTLFRGLDAGVIAVAHSWNQIVVNLVAGVFIIFGGQQPLGPVTSELFFAGLFLVLELVSLDVLVCEVGPAELANLWSVD